MLVEERPYWGPRQVRTKKGVEKGRLYLLIWVSDVSPESSLLFFTGSVVKFSDQQGDEFLGEETFELIYGRLHTITAQYRICELGITPIYEVKWVQNFLMRTNARTVEEAIRSVRKITKKLWNSQ